MAAAEELRMRFLCQNSFTEDACSPPAATMERLAKLMAKYEQRKTRLAAGESFRETMQKEGRDAPG